jgi:hypothetical protein
MPHTYKNSHIRKHLCADNFSLVYRILVKANIHQPGANQTYTRNKYTRHMPDTGIANLPRIIRKLYKNALNIKKLVR